MKLNHAPSLSGNILFWSQGPSATRFVQAIHECALADPKDRYPTAGHMQEAIVHAAKAELAADGAFLEIMPEETQAIAHRLTEKSPVSWQAMISLSHITLD